MVQAKPARSIELRPFEPENWPLAFSWAQSFWYQIADDFANRDIRDFINFKPDKTVINLGVYRDGELGGLLTYECMSPILVEGHCMFKKGIDRQDSFWGWDTSVPALRLGIDFAWRMGYKKLSSLVFADNRAMNRLLDHIGARLEGVLVNHTQRQGVLVDMNQWAIFKEDI